SAIAKPIPLLPPATNANGFEFNALKGIASAFKLLSAELNFGTSLSDIRMVDWPYVINTETDNRKSRQGIFIG
ncbi:MAG TPA: hypothetical protein VE467_00915, partial [Chryseolinea sp.]|nr:hypothetical protein [Chryseolinea sp.]